MPDTGVGEVLVGHAIDMAGGHAWFASGGHKLEQPGRQVSGGTEPLPLPVPVLAPDSS